MHLMVVLFIYNSTASRKGTFISLGICDPMSVIFGTV